MKTETLEAIGAAGNKATIIGGSVAVAGKWTATDVAAYIGAAVAIIGLLITWYYKREANRMRIEANKRDDAAHQLRQQERQLRIDLMRATGRPVPHDSDMAPLEMDE